MGNLVFRSSVLLPYLLVLGLMSIGPFPNGTSAQPTGGDTAQIRLLKTQLESLQSQIEELQTADSKLEPQGSSRVKSIGSQRPNRFAPTIEREPMYIRLYDLSDIFSVSPHYPAIETNELGNVGPVFRTSSGQLVNQGSGGGGLGGGLGGGSGGVFNMPPTPVRKQEAEMMNLESAQVSLNQLVAAITATVSPGNWGPGDDQAKIQFLGNTLLITANTEMHQQINNLLNLFREHWGKLRTVSIQAYWIRSNPLAINSLLGERGNAAGAGVIDPRLWTKFLESAQTDDRLPYASVLTGHNNQTLNTVSGNEKQLTLDATPYRSTTLRRATKLENDITTAETGEEANADELQQIKTVVGFNPVRQSFREGAFFQVTPLATRGGNFVIMDLHTKINELVNNAAEQPSSIFALLPNGEKVEVKLDPAEYVSAHLSTTIRCPKDQIVLAGGMNFADSIQAPPTNQDEGAKPGSPNLYLFVKATVHTIKEDKSDWSADDSGADLPSETKEKKPVVDEIAPSGE